MSKITLGREFKKIVQLLPSLETAPSFSYVNNTDGFKLELKAGLFNYLKYYNLPGYNDPDISLTIGKFKAFDFDVVAQIYQNNSSLIENSKGLLLFIHGYLDHFGLYGDFVKLLVKDGYIVVGIDLPGHGLSTGKLGHIIDFGQYAHSVEILAKILQTKYQNYQLPFTVSGFSAGAAIGTEFLLRNHNQHMFTKSMWYGPLLRIPKWKYTEIALWLLPFIKYVPRESQNISHDSGFVTFIRYNDPMQARFVPLHWIRAMHHWVARLPKYAPMNIKTCIIQGTQDKTIDWARNIPDLATIYIDHQVHYVPDGYHNLLNESKKYKELVYRYTLEFLDF